MASNAGLVKAAVAVAGVLAAASLAVAVFSASAPRVQSPFQGFYLGARIMPPGPGIGGLPLIPVRVGGDGSLEGVPTHLPWYQYCSAAPPGLASDYPGSDQLVYDLSPHRLDRAVADLRPPWYASRLGQPVRASDFSEPWQGATAVWRSDAQDEEHSIPAVVMRVPGGAYPPAIQREFAPDGFIAFKASDTHYCCLAGYGLDNIPKAVDKNDGHTLLYEACHDDRYDPRDVRTYEMPPGGSYTTGFR